MNSHAFAPFFFVLLLPLSGLSQKRLSTESGVVSFVSKAELELIKASSNKGVGLLNPSTNQFAFSVDIESFQGFNSSLQRSHFNENYLESNKLPRATFAGKIIEEIDLGIEGTYEVRAKGDLTIHGQAQPRIIKAKITVRKQRVTIESQFVVPLADHNIRIPKIVSQKIATEIEVDYRGTFNWK
jgi:hypothetical protein